MNTKTLENQVWQLLGNVDNGQFLTDIDIITIKWCINQLEGILTIDELNKFIDLNNNGKIKGNDLLEKYQDEFTIF